MLLRQIFDPQLAQYAYLIGCQRSGEAIIFDPERDIDQYHALARENNLRITAVAETHIHADFVSGAQEFAQDPEIHLYLSDEGGPEWSYTWTTGRANTHLLKDGDSFRIGNITITAVLTPGHTPEHLSFVITDHGSGAHEPIALITGDFLFMGDVGRPDLLESAAGMHDVMEPSARTLQNSLSTKLRNLGDYLQILPGHGAGSACGKALGAVPTTTLGYERRFNPALTLAITDKERFVQDILQGQPDPPMYFATMKRVNRDGITVTGGVPQPPHLSLQEIQALITTDSHVALLDTRDNGREFHTHHTRRTILTPLHSPHFSMSAGSYLKEQEPFVLLVENAEDVSLATRQLYRIGIDGMRGWALIEELAQAGLCTEKTEIRDIATIADTPLEANTAIIDVRTTSEHLEAHIPGSLSIPYTRLRARLDEIPSNKRLLVHCATGKRAALATSFLRSRGYDAVLLDGDFSAYRKHASTER